MYKTWINIYTHMVKPRPTATCMYIYTYTYIYIYNTWIYIHTYMVKPSHTATCMSMYIHICTYIYNTWIYIYSMNRYIALHLWPGAPKWWAAPVLPAASKSTALAVRVPNLPLNPPYLLDKGGHEESKSQHPRQKMEWDKRCCFVGEVVWSRWCCLQSSWDQSCWLQCLVLCGIGLESLRFRGTKLA